jgi:hypothetical protein
MLVLTLSVEFSLIVGSSDEYLKVGMMDEIPYQNRMENHQQ